MFQTDMQNWLRRRRLTRSRFRWEFLRRITQNWFLTAFWTHEQRQTIVFSRDPVRYGNFILSFSQIAQDGIEGAVAECGVYKGHLSRFIRQNLPERKLYLFDTFEGFDTRDSDTDGDKRFRDTSAEEVLQRIGDTSDVLVRKGFFPGTTAGLESEIFALVIIDFDKYEPTMAALQFFYPSSRRGRFHLCARLL